MTTTATTTAVVNDGHTQSIEAQQDQPLAATTVVQLSVVERHAQGSASALSASERTFGATVVQLACEAVQMLALSGPWAGPVHVHVSMHVRTPRSWPKWQRVQRPVAHMAVRIAA